MPRIPLLSLSLLLAFPLGAQAQVVSSGTTPLPAAGPALKLPATSAAAPGAPTMTLSGYDRVRWVSQVNYDLDPATAQDAWLSFSDIRSYMSLETAWQQWKLVSSVDLAGTDFDEGTVMGFDSAPRQRPISVNVRQLYLDWADPTLGLTAQLGRVPARLGYGLVSAINRDAFRLGKKLPDIGGFSKSTVTGVWVRGGKGATQASDGFPQPPGYVTVAPGVSGTTVTNDPSGAPHELNTYALVFNTVPLADHRLQAFVAQQLDASQNGVYPQKRYVDLNADGALGAFKYGGEAVYLGGESPSAAGKRQALNSFALLLAGSYVLGDWEFGLTAGRGGGDSDPTDGENDGFQSLFLDESAFAYNHLFGDDMHGFNGTDASIGNGAGLNNVTFVQPSVAYHVTPALSTSLSYTKHLATAPVRVGSGVLGKGTPTGAGRAVNIGDELDARIAYKLGVATIYGAASSFVPGDVFAFTGFGAAASKLEVGTEVRF